MDDRPDVLVILVDGVINRWREWWYRIGIFRIVLVISLYEEEINIDNDCLLGTFKNEIVIEEII